MTLQFVDAPQMIQMCIRLDGGHNIGRRNSARLGIPRELVRLHSAQIFHLGHFFFSINLPLQGRRTQGKLITGWLSISWVTLLRGSMYYPPDGASRGDEAVAQQPSTR